MDDALNRGALRNRQLQDEVDRLADLLARRTRALNAVSARNVAARSALVRVLGVADVTEGPVDPTKIHDAIGHEIIEDVLVPKPHHWHGDEVAKWSHEWIQALVNEIHGNAEFSQRFFLPHVAFATKASAGTHQPMLDIEVPE